MSNNEQMGGASPHTGDMVKAIRRESGLAATESAVASKTRSPANAADGPNYHYKDAGSGWGGNVLHGSGPG